MTVADVDALLYLPGHTRQGLLRALRVPALSPGWQGSFRALLNEEPGSGNAGLAVTSPPPAWPGFRAAGRHGHHAAKVTRRSRYDSRTRRALHYRRPARSVPHAASPARQQPGRGVAQLLALRTTRGGLLPGHCQAGTRWRGQRLSAQSSRPSATNSTSRHHVAPSSSIETHAPVLLISAGIGATPVLAMLQALAKERSDREIWWLYGARDGREHPFAAETRALLTSLPNARAYVYYSRPDPNDLKGRDFDRAGRLTASVLAELKPPSDAEAYVCGPTAFMDDISAGLAALGFEASRIHTELVRAGAGPDAGHRGDAGAGTPPARRPARKRPDDRVRPQRPHDPVEPRLRAPCSNSPSPATYPSAGHAAPASVTPARRR